MAWVTATTKTTTTLINAAICNQDISANMTHLGNVHAHRVTGLADGGGAKLIWPACILSLGADMTINSGLTLIVWSGEVLDAFAMHESVTNPSRITITRAGRYLAHLHIEWPAPDVAGRVTAYLYKNAASQVTVVNAEGATETTSDVSLPLVLSAGDYLQAYAEHSIAEATRILTAAGCTRFEVIWLGES